MQKQLFKISLASALFVRVLTRASRCKTILFVAAIAALLAPRVEAQILFSNDFENAPLSSTVSGPSGFVAVTPAGSPIQIQGGNGGGNMTLTAGVDANGAGGSHGLFADWDYSGSTTYTWSQETAYYFGVAPAGTPLNQIQVSFDIYASGATVTNPVTVNLLEAQALTNGVSYQPILTNGTWTHVQFTPDEAQTMGLGLDPSQQMNFQIAYGNGGFGFTNNAVVELDNVLIQILQAPQIIQQPRSATTSEGTAFTNAVVASGTAPLYYQWYSQTGGALPEETNASLIFDPVQNTDTGDYYVVVTNVEGAVTSSVATVSVAVSPVFMQDLTAVTQTNNLMLFAGAHPAFTLQAEGEVPLTYQWYSNDVAAAGATNSSYSLAPVQSNGQTNFFCVVSNPHGSTTSAVVSVTLQADPTAPYPQAVLAGDPDGFWRLNEASSDGVIAHDYWGGNNGIYTNTTLGNPGYNPSEPAETSAGFGLAGTSFVNNDVDSINGIDFSAPTNSSSAFTIEAWVQGYQQTVDAGLVSKGYGNGGEQFNLDCGSDVTNAANPYPHSFRFFVRDASGTVYAVNSDVNPNDFMWHYLAAVCDEPDGYIALYVDGRLVGTNSIPTNAGILSSSQPMLIGSRPSGASTTNDDQFVGYMDDVAVYPRALSAAEVQDHFDAAGVAAKIAVEPENAVAGEFGAATFSAGIVGSSPISYQWYKSGQAISGATNSTLVLTNVQSSDNGSSYYLTVANQFGNDQSASATLTVVSGKPQIYTDVPPQLFVAQGGSVSIPVTAYGTEPVSYQWQFKGADLADNGRISGAQSNVLTIANAQVGDAGAYQVIAANGFGSVTSSVATVIVGSNPIGFNTSGFGWTSNQAAWYTTAYTTPVVSNNVLTLTDETQGQGEERSFFYNTPQYIGAFEASFTYQDVGGGGADGACFVLQNDPRGTSALGDNGGSLGVDGNSPITPSFELELNILSADTTGFSVNTNGNVGPNTYWNYVASGDPIGVTMYYNGSTLSLTLTDAVAQASFSTNVDVNIPVAVGGSDTAYVGFTGSDGGVGAIQTITNFSFASVPQESIGISPASTVISWPGLISGYVLQENSNLATTNWIDVTNADNVINGQHQVVIPRGSANAFYRLKLP